MPVRSHSARQLGNTIAEAAIVALLLLIAVPATGARISCLRAQTQSTVVAQGAAQQSSAAGPAATAPTGASSAAPSVSSVSTASTPTPAAKKVWTNDDVGDLRANPRVAVGGRRDADDMAEDRGTCGNFGSVGQRNVLHDPRGDNLPRVSLSGGKRGNKPRGKNDASRYGWRRGGGEKCA